jgi:hypothetical protein
MVKGKATLVETELSDEETLRRVTSNVYKALALYPKNRHLIFKVITPLWRISFLLQTLQGN